MIVGKNGHPIGVDSERLTLPAKRRAMDIILAVRLLQREGFGTTTPNRVAELITEAIQKQRSS